MLFIYNLIIFSGISILICASGLSNIVKIATDSSVAKSVVCRRELGEITHLEVKDLWLQKEVSEGKVVVSKVPGDENPADLMTKILGLADIESRPTGMGICMLK